MLSTTSIASFYITYSTVTLSIKIPKIEVEYVTFDECELLNKKEFMALF